jgi:sugar phosphate isomerase/epimerase
MSWPASSFAHRNIRLYEAEHDRVIPRAATADDFAKRFGADTNIGVIPCGGGHVADDCYQGADVAAWLSGLAE